LTLPALALAAGAAAQTPVPCGQLTTGFLESGGAPPRYTIAVAAGDFVTLRATGFGVKPLLDLFDPDFKALVEGEATITRRLTRAGSYFVHVRGDPSAPSGPYQFVWQRVVNPCNALALACGRMQNASIEREGEIDAYTLPATAGDSVLLRMSFDTLEFTFVPMMELYDPTGRFVDAWIDEVTVPLAVTGAYTVVVRYGLGPQRTGPYGIVWRRLSRPCESPELPCGGGRSGVITAPGETHAYSFQVAAGDRITARVARTSGSFTPYLELYDATGAKLAQEFARIDRLLDSAGLMTLLVGDSRRDRLGGYAVAWQKINSPCNPTPLACGVPAQGAVNAGAELAGFTLGVGGGDSVSIRAERRSGALSPFLELYRRDGAEMASGPGAIAAVVPSTANFTLLVRDALGAATGAFTLLMGRPNNPCPLIDLESPRISLLAPRGGESLAGGTIFPIRWASTDNFALASHQIRFSTDSGGSFSEVVVASLSPTAQSYSWTVPTDLTTNRARLRVIAADRGGNTAQDESRDFSIAAAAPASRPIPPRARRPPAP